MLNKTLDDVMNKSLSLEMHTKTSKFTNVFKNISKNASYQQEIINKKLDKYVDKGEIETSSAIKEILSSYDTTDIVENPDEISIDLEFKSSGIPFFRSLYNKLLAQAA